MPIHDGQQHAAIVGAGASKAVSFYATDPTDLVLDITGYFVEASSGTGLAFYPVTPYRVSDTPTGSGSLGGPSVLGGSTKDTNVLQSNCGLPSSTQAYSLNFTVCRKKTNCSI